MYGFKVKSRIERGGKFVMGEGRAKLLRLIDNEKSLRKASKKMKMSYRYAWGVVRDMNRSFGKKVVKPVRGGAKGGRTMLTKAGKDLLSKFEEKNKQIDALLRYGRKPSLAADIIVVTDKKVLLIKRKNPPFKGMYALPGGFINYGESGEDAALRELKEETSVSGKSIQLFGVYSKMGRDPRGHTVSLVYEVKAKSSKYSAGSDAADARFFPLKKLPKLGFDHALVLKEYVKSQGRASSGKAARRLVSQ